MSRRNKEYAKDWADYLMVRTIMKSLTAMVVAIDAFDKAEDGLKNRFAAARAAYTKWVNTREWTREIYGRKK